VYERDLEPEETRARAFVDQICAGARKFGERRFEIAHLVGHVVHAGPSLREEATNWCVFTERLEQFDTAVADADRSRTDSLIFHRRAVLDPRAEQPLVRREGRVEVVDRDS
jgi:hypothetical protein